MMTSRPPRIADWLLRRMLAGPQTSSLIGDLHEQRQRGRSRSWYWRQVLAALAADMWRYKTSGAITMVVGISLPRIYMLLVWPRLTVRLERLWLPHMIYSSWSWIVTDPWAYRLQPYSWTGRIVYCALLAVTAWMIRRWRPAQRRLLLALFLVTQVGLNIPFFLLAGTTWLLAPVNAMFGFGLLWFSAFTFVAIPVSILLGGGCISNVRGVTA